MITINDLISLFNYDDRIVKIITSTYYMTQEMNKEESDRLFGKLYELKLFMPDFEIIVDNNNEGSSKYSPMTNTIYLKGNYDEIVFLHELTHFLSYSDSEFIIPKEYKQLKGDFLSKNDRDHTELLYLVEQCRQEKVRLIKTEGINKSIINDIVFYEQTEIEANKSMLEYRIICMIEDIIDSLFGGMSYSRGLRFNKDNNSYVIKAEKTAGHGCEYFESNSYDFEEVLADYNAIKLLSPDNKLFAMLKHILGEKFILFLDDKCKKISEELILDSRKINDNIKK